MNKHFSGKSVFITGAGSGIGYQTALVFAEGGYPPMAPTEGNRALLARLNAVNRDLGLPAMAEYDPARRGAADSGFVAADVDTLGGLGIAGLLALRHRLERSCHLGHVGIEWPQVLRQLREARTLRIDGGGAALADSAGGRSACGSTVAASATGGGAATLAPCSKVSSRSRASFDHRPSGCAPRNAR